MRKSSFLAFCLCMLVLKAPAQGDTAVINSLTRDMYRLYPKGDSAEAFMQATDRLMEETKKAGDEDLYWRTWSNQATYASRHISKERAMEITKAMTSYAKEHDSKLGLYMSSYTNAVVASGMRMERQAEQMFLEALKYQKQYLPERNAAPDYLALAKIYYNRKEKDRVLEMCEKALAEKDIVPAQRLSAWCYKCMAALINSDKEGYKQFLEFYADMQHVAQETGLTSGLMSTIEVYYAQVKGDYPRMLKLAQELGNPLDRLLMTAHAYTHQGRWQEAYNTFYEYKHYSDSVNNEAVKEMSAEHDLALDVAKAENETKDLRIANQQLLLWSSIGIGMLIIAFLGFYLYRHKKHEKEIKAAYNQLEEAYDKLEETTAAKERIESELRIAREIQMSMVPQVFTDFPTEAGIDLYASMTPAKAVGGDLYDFFLQGQKLYFCVGDVSGKGVPASMTMAVAVNLFRTVAKEGFPPAYIATRLNDTLAEDNESGMFVTMFIAEIDISTGEMTFCNAGHNPPVILERPLEQGGFPRARFINVESNVPIGLWTGYEFVGERIETIRQRPLFIYTDGVTEAENDQQEQHGEERLLELFNTHRFVSACETVESVRQDIAQHVGDADPSDDMTMLCLSIK